MRLQTIGPQVKRDPLGSGRAQNQTNDPMVPDTPLVMLPAVMAAAVLGIGVGCLTSWLLKLGWRVTVAFTDAILAVGAALVWSWVIVAIDEANGVLQSRLTFVLAMASVSIVLRHLLRLRLARRSS